MRTKSICVVMVSLLFVSVASAELIRGIDIDFVTIGNAGNAGDTRPEASPSDCGAVSYEYRIGKYEITNGQSVFSKDINHDGIVDNDDLLLMSQS